MFLDGVKKDWSFPLCEPLRVSPASGILTLPIWSNGAPGFTPTEIPEADSTSAAVSLIAGKRVIRLGWVSSPTLTIYPPRGRNTGAAIVVFPGGAYRILAMDLEGTEVCEWLSSIGVTCALLKYRVPNTGPYPKSVAALQDAQRAFGIVRAHAIELQVDPRRIGVLGFSAGAHLAAALSAHHKERLYDPIDAVDNVEIRPDFQALIYPAYLTIENKQFQPNPDLPVTEQTPPAFIVQSEDDSEPVENAIVYFGALKTAGVPVEMHIFAEGGHGYGLRRTALPVTSWPDNCQTWLHSIGILP